MSSLNKTLPLEIERKYLIAYPDITFLEACPNYSKSDICQTYLKNEGSTTGMRIRKRGANGIYKYTKTFKRDITPVKRIELEDEISQQEYKELLKSADPMLKTISKTRHCFSYNNQLFELDIYTFWNDRATLELELENENQKIDFPPFIKVIKEVTGDLRYRNRSLAGNIVTETI